MFEPMGYSEAIFWIMLAFFAGFVMSPKRATTWRASRKQNVSRPEPSESERSQH